MIIYIYCLIDPITKEIRYVGKTDNVNRRYAEHKNTKTNKNKSSYSRNWIKSLQKINLQPEIKILEIVNNLNWEDKEIYWIKFYKDKGCKLTNLTAGGRGVTQLKKGETSKYNRVHYIKRQKHTVFNL